MIRKYVFLLAALLSLCGCSSPPPVSIDTPPSVETVPDRSPAEEAALLYTRYLEGGDCGTNRDADLQLPASSFDPDQAKDMFYVRDITGDGVPELYLPGPRPWPFFTVQDGQMVILGYLDGYDTILANGAIFYHRLDGAPMHEDFAYQGLSPESQALPDISFFSYDMDQDGVQDTYFLEDSEEPVPYEEWQRVTAPYFAAWKQECTEEQRSLPFSEWLQSLNISP